jgi:hypothetical protein
MSIDKFPIKKFSEQDILDLLPAMKIGVLGTVTPDGLPHVTLITTLMASKPDEVVWGQFMEGTSKKFIRNNPRTGFLIMGLDKSFWTAQAEYTRSAKDGKDYEFYNNTALFRYNSYFGVHTVHYMDLKGQSGKHPLPMNKVVFAAIQTMIAKFLTFGKSKKQVMNQWTQAFFNKIDNLKFLCYVDTNGYPVVLPVIQAQALDPEHICFSFGAFGEELAAIPPFTPVAILSMALSMQDVQVRGTYQGSKKVCGIQTGVLQVDWVYNSMPPKPMQIYPPVPVETITQFE